MVEESKKEEPKKEKPVKEKKEKTVKEKKEKPAKEKKEKAEADEEEKDNEVDIKKVIDKITTGLLILLMATPILILAYIFYWFMSK